MANSFLGPGYVVVCANPDVNPKCVGQGMQPLAWFQDHRTFHCPICGYDSAINIEQIPGLADDLRKLDDLS